MSPARIVAVGAARCHRCGQLVAVLELDVPGGPHVRPRLRWHQRDRDCRCATTSLPPVERVPRAVRMRVDRVLRDVATLESWQTLAPTRLPEVRV
jgi:hypothetical protein